MTGTTFLRGAALVAAALGAAAGASAQPRDGLTLAQSRQCLQCHAVDRDGIGPSFRTIRAIYRDVRAPEAMLMAVIRDGSNATLGPLRGHARMPDSSERPAVSDAEARALARWILHGDGVDADGSPAGATRSGVHAPR